MDGGYRQRSVVRASDWPATLAWLEEQNASTNSSMQESHRVKHLR